MNQSLSGALSRLARIYLRLISLALVLLGVGIGIVAFDYQASYSVIAVIPLALAAITWPPLHAKLPTWLTLSSHAILILVLIAQGVAGITFGIDEQQNFRVSGISGEWRRMVGLGVVLLGVGILQGVAVWASRLYRVPRGSSGEV